MGENVKKNEIKDSRNGVSLDSPDWPRPHYVESTL